MPDPTRPSAPSADSSRGTGPGCELDVIMRQVALGDQSAFADLYDHLAPSVYHLVRLVLALSPRADADADAAVRATFAEIWSRAAEPDLTAGLAVETWALAAAHRRAVGLRPAATG